MTNAEKFVKEQEAAEKALEAAVEAYLIVKGIDTHMVEPIMDEIHEELIAYGF